MFAVEFVNIKLAAGCDPGFSETRGHYTVLLRIDYMFNKLPQARVYSSGWLNSGSST